MAKCPYFPFYASDWLGSNKRAQMTLAEQGAYINLLARQWADASCSLPDDDGVLAKLSELGEGWFANGSVLVRQCFPKHPTLEHRIANERLLFLRAERDTWVEKSREGGRKSAQARRMRKLKGGCQMVATNGQPNANSPSPSPKKKKKTAKAQFSFLPADLETARWMHTLNCELTPDTREPHLESWANEIRLLRERDERTDEQIRALYQWAHNDTFWRANILCPKTLRKQWEKLDVKRRATHGEQGNTRGRVREHTSPDYTLFDPDAPLPEGLPSAGAGGHDRPAVAEDHGDAGPG